MPKYCYSTADADSFYGHYDTESDAISAATQAVIDEFGDGDEPFTIWIGEGKPAQEYLSSMHRGIGLSIADDVEERLADDIYWEDGNILTLTDEQYTELGKLVADWLAQHATFNCDGVVNIRQITI